MNGRIHQALKWFFAEPTEVTRRWEVVVWWELRRLPYNLIVGVFGALCFFVFFWAITSSGKLPAGEDAVEPIALLAAPIFINILYTFGWVVELITRRLKPSLWASSGPKLLKLGLGLSLTVIGLPALFWTGYRLLQMGHFVQ